MQNNWWDIEAAVHEAMKGHVFAEWFEPCSDCHAPVLYVDINDNIRRYKVAPNGKQHECDFNVRLAILLEKYKGTDTDDQREQIENEVCSFAERCLSVRRIQREWTAKENDDHDD